MKLLGSQAVSGLCRELAGLLHAGVDVAAALDAIADDPGGVPAASLSALHDAVSSGTPLSDAMEARAEFPPAIPAMLRVGERSGRMEDALLAVADYYDGQARLDRDLRRSVAYPALMLAIMLAAMTVLLTRVLPVFRDVYATMGTEMEGLAAVLLGMGDAMSAAMPVLAVLLAVLLLSVLALGLCPGLRRRAASLLAGRSYDKGLLRGVADARVAQCLALCLASGMDLEQALAMAADAVSGMGRAPNRCLACASALSGGEPLRDALSSSGLLPPRHARLLALGWGNGMDDKIVRDMADDLSENAMAKLNTAIGGLEPAMVSACSVLIGAMLVSVMLPLLSAMASMG